MARILLAEDDDAIRELFTVALGQAGHVVTPARDGTEALELVKSQGSTPDLLVTDLVMPHMDGLELASVFRADSQLRTVPILVVTASVPDDKRLRSLIQFPLTSVLFKPIRTQDLLDRVAGLSSPALDQP